MRGVGVRKEPLIQTVLCFRKGKTQTDAPVPDKLERGVMTLPLLGDAPTGQVLNPGDKFAAIQKLSDRPGGRVGYARPRAAWNIYFMWGGSHFG
jgi:hypothetical protein